MLHFLLIFVVSFVQALVATLEVLNITHLRKLRAAGYGCLNSGTAFILIYIVVVDATNRFWLIIPWIVGDVLAVQIGMRMFKKD
jgi:hypothetical protein